MAGTTRISVGDSDVSSSAPFPIALYSSGGTEFTSSSPLPVTSNQDVTIFSSTARTATVSSSDITNYNGVGAHVVIDCTAAAATPSVVFTVEGKDALSGKYYTLLASAAITGTGTTVLRIHPSLTAAANTIAKDMVPKTFRVTATHADTDSITYSVGASLVG